MPECRYDLGTYTQAYTTKPSGVFMRSAPLIQITKNNEINQMENVTVQVRHKKIRPENKKAEMGAALLLHPYGGDSSMYGYISGKYPMQCSLTSCLHKCMKIKCPGATLSGCISGVTRRSVFFLNC